ncbi:MAG: purine-binding chemotaxis protein CheW [Rhodanobacter sp.]|nr:MAG: purine-binding chemotaxis protein CheW [Rhodanobacter sp.]TAL99297.1 MAG: purine-binding chemotaxis protein CheW [Rhodanobacter sp.]TAM41536.1 MAG: purine-binding chemotaxis protein CheW [Rhodanobacter sp.]TAN28356.1 MAG: purine-binding chemotaxis protein CheW [Rhodanobacter sp.]
MNAPASVSVPTSQHWLSFQVGDQLYAAPLAAVSEVIRDGDITPVPGSAADVLGVRHLRGRIVPVLDGGRRMGVPPLPPDPARVRIVMLAQAGQLVGLRVDAVGELLCTDGLEIEPPPPGRARRTDDPVTGVLSWQGGFVALLDVCRLCRLSGEAGHVA